MNEKIMDVEKMIIIIIKNCDLHRKSILFSFLQWTKHFELGHLFTVMKVPFVDSFTLT